MAISNVTTPSAISYGWQDYYAMTKPKVVLLSYNFV